MSMLLKGKIIKGEGLGRAIGYPTANIDRRYFYRYPVPDGVWACKVRVESRKSKVESVKWLKAVAVIGMEDKKRGGKKVEIHILDFKKNIYGWHVEAVLMKRMRKLKKFSSVSLLKKQIRRDIAMGHRVVIE